MAAGKTLQIKRGTAANLGAVLLAAGELGLVTDDGRLMSSLAGAANVVVGGTGVIRDTAAGATFTLGDLTLKAAPTTDLMAANKKYVDDKVVASQAGLDFKQSVRAATVVTGTLATAFANGQVIDTVTLATGDRILIKNQGTPSENGIYVVAASGAPTRATDMPAGAGFSPGAFMFVEEGSQADTQWVMTNDGAINIGVTSLVFAQFGSGAAYTASLGVQKVGNDFRADILANSGIALTSNSFGIKVDATAASLEVDTNGLRIKRPTAQYKFMMSGATPFDPAWTDVSTLAGAGLTAATGVLAVGAGTLVTVAADTVGLSPAAADYSFIKATTTPWTPAWATIDSLAGAGLVSATGVLAVGAGTLITVAADTVGHAAGASDYQYVGTTTTPWTASYISLSNMAGAGLVHSAGVFHTVANDADYGAFA